MGLRTTVVLMGVSGSGKTTIGRLVAERVGGVFADADDFHSAANKAKMRAGEALNDEDRRPWLEALHGLLREWSAEGRRGVLACSALKASYRATLVGGLADEVVRFVWLDGPRELLEQRLAGRSHEFMLAGLLESQLRTLEPPRDAVRVVNDRAPEVVVEEIVLRLGMGMGTAAGD